MLGRNTQDCVNAGVQYGLIGAIDRVVSEMISLSGERTHNSDKGALDNCRVLLMGGDAGVILAATSLEVKLQSDMIFNGLMLISSL